ncbi:cytochrome c oxidase assembly protein [Parablastomonas sp. CN1-191]|uniref:cytochrome c oxidase assembly protein n=1 Tax=Parablastomonas sp. CN1-191 TaxID=3400908 RepID=UPI003BF81BBD
MATLPAANANRRVGLIAAGLALAMLGLGFAAVPLYRIFCQATGYGGTTQRVDEATARDVRTIGSTITVRFDGNVERGMPWRFGPEQVSQTLPIGGRKMAFFKAKNLSDHAITGQAGFNVQPEQAGKYFNKVQCFCFTEQTLQAGQEVDMPVVYYVDPAILNDEDTRDIQEITLSYTFHPTPGQPSKALDRARTAG